MFTGKDWVNSLFPEAMFPPHDKSYYSRLADGYDKMKSQNVLICGICKNIEANVSNMLASIYTLGEMFGEYSVFIYENDSDDNTKPLIVETAAKLNIPNFTLQTEQLNVEPHEQDKSLYRRERLAESRNKYLDFIKDKCYDYVIVCDLDIRVGWSYEGIANTFSYDKDVVGSNGIVFVPNESKSGPKMIRLFYDTWAYRKLDGQQVCGTGGNLFNFKRGQNLEEVSSCFGGMAIYKRECIKDEIRYSAHDCDHVTLHKQMRENGCKIYMNPSQIVIY